MCCSGPTYASKYPPAQGFLLAIGQVAFGHPGGGVCGSRRRCWCGAVGWMLLGWVPRPWAIFGALLVALRLGAGSYWNESYWGGSVAAIGGALLLGAARRLWRRVRVGDAACSRSASRCSPPAGPTRACWWRCRSRVLLRDRTPDPPAAPRRRGCVSSLPVVLLLGAALGVSATVNRAVTGDPFEFPHRRLRPRPRHHAGLSLWQPIEPLTRRHCRRRRGSECSVCAPRARRAGTGWRWRSTSSSVCPERSR